MYISVFYDTVMMIKKSISIIFRPGSNRLFSEEAIICHSLLSRRSRIDIRLCSRATKDVFKIMHLIFETFYKNLFSLNFIPILNAIANTVQFINNLEKYTDLNSLYI